MASKLQEFISDIANAEGGKSSVSIGNVREILKLINQKLNGELYRLINGQFSAQGVGGRPKDRQPKKKVNGLH